MVLKADGDPDDAEETEIWSMAGLYVIPSDAKIIISDVDGTITKSDVIGQIMPLIGGDWSHEGIVDFFKSLVANGYYMIYLTARAMSMSVQTKGYLESVKQGDSMLPDGPLMLSPDRLFHSFKREVILKKPEVFKIAALRDLSNIFGKGAKPLFAGFGNRDTVSFFRLIYFTGCRRLQSRWD